ncbi:unnamed protein product [Peronospora destructor]|uniref:Uncharacterized protein n=1 Tax=Peronospora destructor TaxID=86335 RepID=A0AAV0U4I6_9STRA|nr:unnamed protein product [Peronospora destructor]
MRNPRKRTAKIFEILNEKIFDKTLAYLITKAIESDSTNPLMLGLQSALFEKWLAQKATPKEVKSMLQEATQSNSDSERKIYDQIAYQYEKFFGKVKITVEDSGTSGEVKLDPSS